MSTIWKASIISAVIIAAIAFSPAKVYRVKADCGVDETNPSSSTIQSYVTCVADEIGTDPIRANFILSHESQDCGWGRVGYFDPKIEGDDGNSRGCWQISKIYHPEVSDACADDFECSTLWALIWQEKGHASQWSTWLYRYKWYGYTR